MGGSCGGEALVEIAGRADSPPITGNQLTLYLCNDRVNKRSRVEGVLKRAGLDDDAARSAMMTAHRTGRGAVRTWHISDPESEGKAEAEAEALRAELIKGDLLRRLTTLLTLIGWLLHLFIRIFQPCHIVPDRVSTAAALMPMRAPHATLHKQDPHKGSLSTQTKVTKEGH